MALPLVFLGLLIASQRATAADNRTASQPLSANAPVRKSVNYDFPIYTNKPAGRQLTGQHVPATTPALTPEEARKKFTLPDGFEIRLFASEPEVVNPVAMTWDERGRLWVVELYEYPLGAPKGEKPRDRIKILEDTDGDGRADKVTVFADGLNLATGILLGYGGVFVGQAPDFLFLQDTDGDDKADKRTVLKTGFGLDDRHELLNGFTWGPDGWLYMTHGVFTHSKVKDPNNPNDSGVTVDAAVARYHPRTKRIEVFADGTSNPWGVDFDRAGNAFVSACVIDHLFHMAPGGHYVRQGGSPANPYGYQLLPSIVDHKHHMAAYAGVDVYQGDQYPEEYRGAVLIGNIHDNAIHQDRLTPNGSSFKASFVKDFVRANDGWFMPVSMQTGPDGAVWIMDWYDRYPCYQNARADPDGLDREFGRIWRVVYTGKKPGAPVPSHLKNLNLAKLSTGELAQTLAHPNVWHRRTAQRLLSERRDATAKPALKKLLTEGTTIDARLAALWTLHSSEQLDDVILDQFTSDKEPTIRAWVARLSGERGDASEPVLHRLVRLARDPEPSVRLAVATAARQFSSGSLTVNTPPPAGAADANIGEVLAGVVEISRDGKDPLIPFMIWMAAEPKIAKDFQPALNWLAENGPAIMPLSGELARKTMRRICDTRQTQNVNYAVEFVAATADKDAALAIAALDGLIEGQKGKALAPTVATGPFFAKLATSNNAQLKDRGQRLGTLWGDATAILSTLNVVDDANATLQERVNAIQAARQLKNDAAREAMVKLLSKASPETLLVEAIRALGEIGGDSVSGELVQRWKKFTPTIRRAAAEVLASRSIWALALLSAIESKSISASELPATVIRSFSQSKDDLIRQRAAQAIGRIREANTDKLKLIAEKRQVVLNGPIDMGIGHELAKKTCFVCHKLHGEGADVGPDLTGVGRSTLDALLANIIDPNQIIGKGYENVEVETKDGRTVIGRLIENTDTRVKLVSAGPKEDVIAKPDIASMRISEMSVMPEGLEQMPDADFRNLIWYILNPPQDNRPLTPELRKELTGEEKRADARTPAIDGEAVALWNPEWRVICPGFEGAPAKLSEYAGRRNVLMTHPVNEQTAAALERLIEIPAGKKTVLSLDVAAHEKGDWELRVLANGKLLKKQTVDKTGERWKQIEVDLSSYAGQKIAVRLENAANGWEWEFGYWSDLKLTITDPQQAAR